MTRCCRGMTLAVTVQERAAIDIPRHLDPNLKPIVSAALRSVALVAIAMLLIVVLLPAAIVAAGT